MLPTHLPVTACADALRTSADRIAAVTDRPPSTSDLTSLIAWVKDLGAQASTSLRARLSSLAPEVGWVDEGQRPELDSGSYWLHDPVDGAYHLLQGLPLWSSSLVLVRDGRPELSMVYDPAARDLFVAIRGGGATRDGEPIAVSAKATLGTAVVGTSIPPLAQVGARALDESLSFVTAASRHVFVLRAMAAVSLQLAWVAAGRLDAFFESGRDTEDWLAGALLVAEAGGAVTDLQGAALGWEADGVVAGNGVLQAGLLQALRA